jgi:glycosyltransferase involved in cell wall biosynthesis
VSDAVNTRTTARKPVVLVFLHYYLPGYKSGGPIRTIANLVEALGDEFDFRIVTSDRDATDSEPYPGLLSPGQWARVGKADVLYLPPDRKGLRAIAGILRATQHDTLYLNSFFDPVFTVMPLLARRLGLFPKRRCVVAPRGEFSPGALRLKAPKKRAYLTASRTLGLYGNVIWQASSSQEAEDIRRVMGAAAMDIRVVVNLPASADPETIPVHRPRVEGEPLRVVFLSRISPMKNLEFAIEVLQQVQRPVTFDIYGPVREAGYWEHCRKLLTKLPRHVTASYRGGVEHDKVSSVLSGCDLFFLPTRGENYGHVIYEALAVGTPVLIADTTPWRGLADFGAGWDLSLAEPEAFSERIDRMANLSSSQLSEMRVRVSSFLQRYMAGSEMIQANRQLFVSQP